MNMHEILLRELLIEGIRSEILKNMKQAFDYISKKYFSSERNKYPYPDFKVKENLRTAGAYQPRSNVFLLNMDFAQEEETLKATMYHEAIHYYQTKGGLEFSKTMHRIHGYHDDYFKEMMKKINSGEGKKYIDVLGNFTDIRSGKSKKEFWVYVLRRGMNYSFAWSPTKNERFVERIRKIKEYYKYDEGFIFKTSILIFKEAPRASMSGRSVKTGAVSPTDKYYNEMTNEFKTAKKEYF